MKPAICLLLITLLATACQTGGPSRPVERLEIDLATLQKRVVQVRLIGGPVEIRQSTDDILTVEMLAGGKDAGLPAGLPGLFATDSGGGVDINVGAKYMGNTVRIQVPADSVMIVQSADSNVTGGDLDCDLWLNLQNGDVKIDNLRGQFKARTIGGRISATFGELRGEPAIEVETLDGPISLGLPRDASADVHARLLGGRMTMDHKGAALSGDVPGAIRDVPGELLIRDASWRIGQGGPIVRISSTGGSARVTATR